MREVRPEVRQRMTGGRSNHWIWTIPAGEGPRCRRGARADMATIEHVSVLREEKRLQKR